MLKVNEVAFFCYAVTDMERARKFYEGALGLKCSNETQTVSGHWIEYDIGATTLSLGCSPAFTPSADGATAALEVDDFEAALAHLHEHKVDFSMEPFETPVCHMAIITDPDGSKIVIHKRKPGNV